MLFPFMAEETESTLPKNITLYSALNSLEMGCKIGHSQAKSVSEKRSMIKRIFFMKVFEWNADFYDC